MFALQEVDQQAIEEALGIELGKEDEDEDEEQEGLHPVLFPYRDILDKTCHLGRHVVCFHVLTFSTLLQTIKLRMKSQQPPVLMMRQARKLLLSSRSSFLKRFAR